MIMPIFGATVTEHNEPPSESVTDNFDRVDGVVPPSWGVTSGRWDIEKAAPPGDAAFKVTVRVSQGQRALMSPAGLLEVPADAQPGDTVRWVVAGGVVTTQVIRPDDSDPSQSDPA